jgi:hypothetical protein
MTDDERVRTANIIMRRNRERVAAMKAREQHNEGETSENEELSGALQGQEL